jgi:hypothetical protein
MIKKLSDVRDEIDAIVARKDQRGELTGFQGLDKIYTVKQGSFTCFLAAPGHGKSELIFEICINQSLKYGKRHLIYSPETGSVAEIMLELAHKYLQKPVVNTSYFDYAASHKDVAAALDWVNHHFIIEDGDENANSFQQLTEDLLKEEKDSKIPIHTLMAEPYNELLHDMQGYGTRQDLYIEGFMSDVRRFSKKNNKHVFLSFHPGVQSMVTTKDKKYSYYPMPKAREAAGGQAALRKAMTWINLWRPPVNLKNEKGEHYKENEVIVVVEKAKPKGVSFRGQTSLFFDFKKNRYYEEIARDNYYAFQHEKIPAQVTTSYQAGDEFKVPNGFDVIPVEGSNLGFNTGKFDDLDELPF